MAVTSDKKINSSLEKYGIKPINKENLLHYYAPLYGVTNYGLLATNVMDPQWMDRILPKKNINLTNFLLVGSVVGTGLFIYNTKLVRSAPKARQIMYSGCGSLLFTFGSVLLWAVMRNILPNSKVLAIGAGLVTGAALTATGKEYLEYADSKLK